MRASPTVLGWGVRHRTASQSPGCTMGITILQGPWERQTILLVLPRALLSVCSVPITTFRWEVKTGALHQESCCAMLGVRVPVHSLDPFPSRLWSPPSVISPAEYHSPPSCTPSPARLSISCPVLVEEDETQPSFLRSLEACVFSFSHHHRQSSSGHLPSF